MGKFVLGLFLVLLGVGIISGWCGSAGDRAERVSAERSQWPTVQGTVLKSRVTGDPPDVPYRLKVEFAYEVDRETVELVATA